MTNKLIQSKLFDTTVVPCGTKFDIGNNLKDTTFQPGSMGYMSFILGNDESCPNVVFYNTVVIRRGQKGKLRVEQNILLAPIFTVPGVPLEFIIPPNEERRHFVDIQPVPFNTVNLKNPNLEQSHDVITELEYNFLAYMLAKGLFLYKLDSTSTLIDHPLMQKLNISGDGSEQRVFTTKKTPIFRKLINDVEMLVRDNSSGTLIENFWRQPTQSLLIRELHAAEVALTLPILTYRCRVAGILTEAIQYIIEKLKTGDKAIIKNQSMLIESAEMTANAIKATESELSDKIERRFTHIIKNRELVKSEEPVLASISASGKKVTHVFSGN